MTGHHREGSGLSGAVGLCTDLYEVRMVESYLARGMTGPATFSLFVRPAAARPWYVALGVHRVVELLEAFRFDVGELAYLRKLGVGEDTLDWLAAFAPSGECGGCRTGPWCWPRSPSWRSPRPCRSPSCWRPRYSTWCITPQRWPRRPPAARWRPTGGGWRTSGSAAPTGSKPGLRRTSKTTSALLGEIGDEPKTLLLPADRKRNPREFQLSLTRPMGARRDSKPGSFIAEGRQQAIDFYRELVQNLVEWQPRAPKMRSASSETAQKRSEAGAKKPEADTSQDSERASTAEVDEWTAPPSDEPASNEAAAEGENT